MFCESPANKVVLCRQEGLDVSFWANFTEKISWKLKSSNVIEYMKLQQLRCEELKSENFFSIQLLATALISVGVLSKHLEKDKDKESKII